MKNSVKKLNTPKNSEKLFKDLGNKHGMVRQKAREKIVLLGHKAVNQLADLLKNKNKTLRWEAVKALSEISDPDSIPLLLFALQDEDVDVRWMAAEGVVSFGKRGVIATLEALVSNPDSFFLRKGAHHILSEYLKSKPLKELNTLLKSLEHLDAGLMFPAVIFNALKALKIKRNR